MGCISLAFAPVPPQNELERALKGGAIKEGPSYAERYGEETKADADYKITDHLPGPLQDMDRDEVLLAISEAGGRGQGHTLWMQWQEQYGEAGLSSNIVVPHLARALPSPAHGEFAEADGRPGGAQRERDDQMASVHDGFVCVLAV